MCGEFDFAELGADWNHEPSRADVFGPVGVAVYTTDADGWLTYFNEAAATLWGRRPVIGLDRWCGSWRIRRADGTLLPHELCPMAVTLREGRAVRGARALLERPDGTTVPFTPFPVLLRDARGAVTAGSNVLLPEVSPEARARS